MENVTPYEMHEAAQAVLRISQAAAKMRRAGMLNDSDRMVKNVHAILEGIPDKPHFAVTQTITSNDLEVLSETVLCLAHSAGLLYGAGMIKKSYDLGEKANVIAENMPNEWAHGREYDGTCVVCGKEYERTRDASDVFAEMKVVNEIRDRLAKELDSLAVEDRPVKTDEGD